MTERTQEREKALAGDVREAVEHLDRTTRRLRRTNTMLLISGVVSSGASSLVTGVTAAQGPVVGSGIPGWRLACTIGAIFSFGAAVLVGINERLKIGERLASTRQCAGQLRSLEVALTTGSRPWDEIVDRYAEIVETYPELMR